jgi:hypothetical protein
LGTPKPRFGVEIAVVGFAPCWFVGINPKNAPVLGWGPAFNPVFNKSGVDIRKGLFKFCGALGIPAIA